MPGSLRTPERSSRRSLFGVRLHSVPFSTRLQGRKGHKEISSANSPRAPATAGFEPCPPTLLRHLKGPPIVHRPHSAPEKHAKHAAFKGGQAACAPNRS